MEGTNTYDSAEDFGKIRGMSFESPSQSLRRRTLSVDDYEEDEYDDGEPGVALPETPR
jgi:hypothetical protein